MHDYLAENIIPKVLNHSSDDPYALAEGLADASISLSKLLTGSEWEKKFKTEWVFNIEVIQLAWELMHLWAIGIYLSPEEFLSQKKSTYILSDI